MRRSGFITGLGALYGVTTTPGVAAPAAGNASLAGARGRLAALEARAAGRIGAFALDTGSGASLAHRADERFPMCSTFKGLAVAAVLARVDAGRESLSALVRYGRHDLLSYAPSTRAHVARGSMTLGDLCAAAIEVSDNTAANLIVARLGGPNAVTRYARSLDDAVTRLDRYEPAMSESLAGDPRDTTTPRAMVSDWRSILLGTELAPHSRAQFDAWLSRCRTGGDRIRAGIPADWRCGDKTGSGPPGTCNDVAILRSPARAPILLAVYTTGGRATDATVAAVARIVVAAFAV
jgi:beta-lactamase class A